MKSFSSTFRLSSGMERLTLGVVFSIILAIGCVQTALAADDLYQNDGVVDYPGNLSTPPVIDATNFINNNTFIINFTIPTLSGALPLYETSDTLNYVNNGLMMANTGFIFDTQAGSTSASRSMASSFINNGTISCQSTNDTEATIFWGVGQCFINATNVVNAGTITAGLDGLVQVSGQNVDLSHSAVNVENFGLGSAFGSGAFGVDTNSDWDPGFDLGPNYAISSLPFVIFLTNSVCYLQQQIAISTNLNIFRSVFIQDTSDTNQVNYNVYFNTAGIGFGAGAATIEWVGNYIDAATGNTNQTYLYLNNDYLLGASTNVALINGIPDNFTFTESTTRLSTGLTPATPGFAPIFPLGAITNAYSYANVTFSASSFNTNDTILNPTRSVTNLPGRIQISAANELDMTASQIVGANYLSITSTNQFDGTTGGTIQSPYSDINIGVTNGFMTISNFMEPVFPTWNGSVQAWSTRWTVVDSTGVTNDYRVLILGSQLTPYTVAQIQDLMVHSKNSVTISDNLNVFRTFSADTRDLTLTTNGVGGGATSVDGELNVGTANVFWKSALPNLRNFTNNGAVRLLNLAQFSGSSNAVVTNPAVAAVAATGLLSETASNLNVAPNNKVAIGLNTYTFVKRITNSVANQVKIGTQFDASMRNLIAAINRSAGAGSTYSSSTHAHPQVLAGPLTNHSFKVTARTVGTNGNLIATINFPTNSNLTWNNHTNLFGGVNAAPAKTNTAVVSAPYWNFINTGLIADRGSAIWATNFASSGTYSNGFGAFQLDSLNASLTNAHVVAGGSVSIAAGDLLVSNSVWQSASVTLAGTNSITDSGVDSSNVWVVSGSSVVGIALTAKPVTGDLLGTTITNYSPGPNTQVIDTWAGKNLGVNVAGYTNNEAVGRLILDAVGVSSKFKFNGVGTNSAIYIDYLEFDDYLTNGINASYDFSQNLNIASNMYVYFAECVAGGVSIAAKVDAASKAGRNGGRLRWVPAYNGHFSSVNIVYPDGTTNTFNSALASSATIDSNGNGIANAYDPAPFFTSGQIGLTISVTNVPPLTTVIQWNSIPGATNYVYYSTNMAVAPAIVLTNFVSPSLVPPAGGWPITNVVYDPVNPLQTRYYSVKVAPNTTLLYGQ